MPTNRCPSRAAEDRGSFALLASPADSPVPPAGPVRPPCPATPTAAIVEGAGDSPADAATIDLVPCANCRYLVSRRAAAGVCPECAHSVAHSIEVASSVGSAARRHERRLALGLALGLALASIALALLAIEPVMVLFGEVGSPGPWSVRSRGAFLDRSAVLGILAMATAIVVIAAAPPRASPVRGVERRQLVGAGLVCMAAWGAVLWTWVPMLRRSGTPRSILELVPSLGQFDSPWLVALVWIAVVELVVLKWLVDRHGSIGGLARALGLVAVVLVAVAAALAVSRHMADSPLPITGFPPEGPPWWWMIARVAEEIRWTLIGMLGAMGLLAMLIALGAVGLATWRRRHRISSAP